MNPKVRDTIYITLAILNAALLAAAQHDVVAGPYAHYVALASIVVAGMLPRFMAPPPPPPPVAT